MKSIARSSFRALVCTASLALVASLAACDKKDEGAASTGHTTGATNAPTGAKKAKATLKLADLKSAFSAEFDGAKMNNPLDKKVAAFVAKVGAPAADTGRKKIWYALDGDKCSKVELDTKDGSIMDSTTDKGDCGL
jgi:hypothetical protein